MTKTFEKRTDTRIWAIKKVEFEHNLSAFCVHITITTSRCLRDTLYDTRFRTILCEYSDAYVRRFENQNTRPILCITISKVARIYIDRKIRWHADIFEMYDDTDDRHVFVDELFCFLTKSTSITSYDDDMPWSAVSSPYLVTSETSEFLELLSKSHMMQLQQNMESSTRFICDGLLCEKPCCGGCNRNNGCVS